MRQFALAFAVVVVSGLTLRLATVRAQHPHPHHGRHGLHHFHSAPHHPAFGASVRMTQPPPNYVILRAPSSPSPHHPSMRGVRQSYVQPTMRRPYAYGWFGVPPRHHHQWVRHFGYNRAFTQWSSP